ncbi:NAD(P)-dependent oxidoreductase [Levilactobacillus acidifarinae]|uniref:NADH-flavin reductase n=1 Tax=Levilactobacillus acidifarinae DSM 19394 = JCM 15949 TaxID=1423715 RepID=A0A0R1LGH2_9LACO|nr:NAD(P)H-binding protein [Levilactobacillus acidifarinae]KRK94536.1 NADH-flavin reductase [Levilactobacillus acidifarinae DSM 19394]GEO68285.1 flavin reductase [Levilactobacillus acidifarinae]
MKLAIIGATGKTGRAVLDVALARHLDVTAIVRHADRLTVTVPTIEKDLFALTAMDLAPFDAVLCTFASGKKSDYPRVNQHLVDCLTGTPTRLLVVGSGATLFLDEQRTKTVGDTLPLIMRHSSREHLKARQVLQTSGLNWTYVAPPMNYLPTGPATGTYQTGHDVLLADHNGDSSISYADMAVALVDELQHPQNERQLMTVAWR